MYFPNLIFLLGAATTNMLPVSAMSSGGPWASWPVDATDVSYETITLTALTTYCPEATVLSHNGVTYTITAETTLTITDCPCTVTRPMQTLAPTTILYTSCPPTASPRPSPPPPPKNNNNNNGKTNAGNVITVTNLAVEVVTVTSVVQNNAPGTGIANGFAVPTGAGAGAGKGGNGTEFTDGAAGGLMVGWGLGLGVCFGVGVLILL